MTGRVYRVGSVLSLAAGLACAEIVVEPGVMEFGEVRESGRCRREVSVRNTGDGPVRLLELVRTCICASPELPKDVLAPGESVTLTFDLDSNVISGPFHKTFFIRTDLASQPTVPVGLRGTIVPLWQVSPQKTAHLNPAEKTARFSIVPSAGAPAFTSVSAKQIRGKGETPGVSLTTNAATQAAEVSLTVPDGLDVGFHVWTISLETTAKGQAPLTLRVSKEEGTPWVAAPHRARAPADGKPFVLPVTLRLGSGADARPAAPDPSAITAAPHWDGVTFTPDGEVTARGIPMRLTIPAEHLLSWELPKNFYFTIPGSGTASLYLEIIRPPKEE